MNETYRFLHFALTFARRVLLNCNHLFARIFQFTSAVVLSFDHLK